MSPFHRAIATAVGSLAFTAAGIAGAGPALATPDDGEGCVGTPAVPASYVCVISLTPEDAVPDTTTTTVPVTVPPVCYFLDCTEKTTVDVPVPGVAPSNSVVAVLWYQGESIPISVPIPVGTGEILELVTETLAFGVGAADRVVACSLQLSCDPTIELLKEH